MVGPKQTRLGHGTPVPRPNRYTHWATPPQSGSRVRQVALGRRTCAYQGPLPFGGPHIFAAAPLFLAAHLFGLHFNLRFDLHLHIGFGLGSDSHSDCILICIWICILVGFRLRLGSAFRFACPIPTDMPKFGGQQNEAQMGTNHYNHGCWRTRSAAMFLLLPTGWPVSGPKSNIYSKGHNCLFNTNDIQQQRSKIQGASDSPRNTSSKQAIPIHRHTRRQADRQGTQTGTNTNTPK